MTTTIDTASFTARVVGPLVPIPPASRDLRSRRRTVGEGVVVFTMNMGRPRPF